MSGWQTFIANLEPMELMQPDECAFDHPSNQTEMASVFGSALGKIMCNAVLTRSLPMRFAVISAIALHTPGITDEGLSETGRQ